MSSEKSLKSSKQNAVTAEEKEFYVPPVVICYGDVRDITLGYSRGNPEFDGQYNPYSGPSPFDAGEVDSSSEKSGRTGR